ncbi:MAG: hypothetical protein IT364_17240 [Candidatus Hydrogenedentes bacterium]|nr:hypothetical protein [Candidatus Hydrogenedentota bacterium]
MDKKRALSLVMTLTVLAVLSLVTACPHVTPGNITPEERVQAMDAVRAALDRLPDNPTSEEVLDVAVAAIAKRSEFEATGSSDEFGIAWGRFPGGTTYIVDAKGRPGYDSSRAKEAVEEVSPLPAWFWEPPVDTRDASAASRSQTGIPAGPAVLFQVLGTNYANVPAQISPWLLEAGYSVTANPEAGGSVKSLKKVNGPAFLYMGTHGVIARLSPTPTEAAPVSYSAAIMTATEATAEAQATHAEDLADQSLVIVEDMLLPGMTRNFFFTSRFVTKYMTFAPNSFVYMDACDSDHPETTRLKDAFFEAGASLYAGWSAVVNDAACAESTPFLLCRMLGAPAPDGQDQGAPRRPFDYGDAFAELHLRGWDVDQYSGFAELAVTEGPSGGGWLRPSIECLRVDEYPAGASSGQSELIVRGTFGTDPGTGPFHAARSVTCEGEELSIVSWSPEEIRATMPIHGPGSAGDVIVTTQGIKSNAVPLTEWWVTLVYRVDAPVGSGSTVFTEFSIDCRLRYDIHGWRETATSNLHFALSEAEDPPTHFAGNSFGSFRCGGDKSFYDSETGIFIYKIIYGGTGSLPYLASGLGNGCWGSTRLWYQIIASGQPPTLFIDGAVFAEGYPRTSYFLWADGHISNEEQRRLALNEYSNGSIVVSQGETFRFMIGEGGAIEAGESGHLSWQRTLPRYQPTSTTPR